MGSITLKIAKLPPWFAKNFPGCAIKVPDKAPNIPEKDSE
jgi:hypothetical protein